MNETIRNAVPPEERLALDSVRIEDVPAQIKVLRQQMISLAQESHKAHERWKAQDKLRAETGNTIAYLKGRLEEEL